MIKIKEGNTTGDYKSVLYGSKKNIYTFVIGTPENPMGEYFTPEENNKRKREFEELLNKHRFKYYKQQGKYGNDENSYLVVNINLDICKYLFGNKMFNQESFIFGVIDTSSDFKRSTFYYYEQENGKFILKDMERGISNKKEANDFFTKYKNFKYSIPFSIFEKVLNILSDKLEEDYGWDSNYRKYLEYAALIENRTLKHLWEYNCTHLLTYEQNKRREERVREGEEYLKNWMEKYSQKLKLSEDIEKMLEKEDGE